MQFDGKIKVPSFNCTIIAIIRMTQFFAGLIILADNTFLPINFAARNCRFVKPAVTE